MEQFWRKQMEELEKMDFKKLKHQLPLARIKKIMKSDEDVRMISAEAPVLFSKACELFILDLTMRAWSYTDENKRRTLQRSDVAEAIANDEMFDFLIDIVPREDNSSELQQKAGQHRQSELMTEGIMDTLDLDQDREFNPTATSEDFSSRHLLDPSGFPNTDILGKPLPSSMLDDSLALRHPGVSRSRLLPLPTSTALPQTHSLASLNDDKWTLGQLSSIPRQTQASLGEQVFPISKPSGSRIHTSSRIPSSQSLLDPEMLSGTTASVNQRLLGVSQESGFHMPPSLTSPFPDLSSGSNLSGSITLDTAGLTNVSGTEQTRFSVSLPTTFGQTLEPYPLPPS